MIEFMQNCITVFVFCFIVGLCLAFIVFVAIETYDHITGADVKRQAQLDRLRQLEDDEDGMYPR